MHWAIPSPVWIACLKCNDGIDVNAGKCYHFYYQIIYREKILANLSVRKLDDEIVALLRVSAARHGVSMEEEVRQILRRAVVAPERMGDFAVRLFSPAYGDDELILPERETSEPMEFPE